MDSQSVHRLFQIGELIGLAVIAGSLFLIAALIHQHTRAVKHSALNALRGQFMDFQIAIARDEALADLFYRGLHAFDSLDKIEHMRFFNLAGYVLGFWAEGFIYKQERSLPDGYWQAIDRAMIDTAQYPGFQEYWNQRRHWYSVAFQCYVDTSISAAVKQAKPMYRRPEEA